jgi:hypothetical protein
LEAWNVSGLQGMYDLPPIVLLRARLQPCRKPQEIFRALAPEVTFS